MSTPQDYDAQLLQSGGLAAVLIRNKENFLERFCDRSQSTLASARRESHPVIIDTLPAFITRVAMALHGLNDLEFASQSSNIAVAHGHERARFTRYSLADVLKEYQFIRELLVDLLRAESHPSNAEWDVVHRSVDEAMAEAATAYVDVQDSFREMFTAALTHDFRGPLSNAWNYLELMRRADGGQREDFARRAAQNLERIGRMVAALLDASRSNAGERLALDAEEGELKALLLEIIDDLDARRRRHVVVDIPEECRVFWDREKVRRAVYNLLDNACKYSATGSAVTLRAIATHGRVQISVHNFGEPISPEDQPTLFRPFRRTSRAQRSGQAGWGLGLVQVQAIAEAHGGSVAVESDATRGTTFTLDLLRDIRELRAA
ncbi:MAG TPA: HAMP domain-containing sensor histidine kinase [Steroidobacteraceae bacterium]|nr:HAMP domain-containing sensor histidine kinase [Steroidobacteraceae bacterium]